VTSCGLPNSLSKSGIWCCQLLHKYLLSEYMKVQWSSSMLGWWGLERRWESRGRARKWHCNNCLRRGCSRCVEHTGEWWGGPCGAGERAGLKSHSLTPSGHW
jgi:hypothetical protein